METTNNIEITFTSDFDVNKKGTDKLVSRDLKRIFVDELKVAEVKENKVVEKKVKKEPKKE